MRRTVYYGWVNLFVAAIAMVATLPGRTQGLGLVTEPLIADLSINRATYAYVNLWATLIGALFCLPVGRLIDRFGARSVLAVVLACLGVSVWLLGAARDPVALIVTVTLTRGFGQSALSVVSLALVGKWFTRRLNFAMGVYSLLVGIGFIIGFLVVGRAVLTVGWRSAWISIAVIELIVLAPLAWLAVKSTPEAAGLHVEGDAAVSATDQLQDVTTARALQTSAFWVFALSSAVFGLVYSGISLFNESILKERGFDAATYHQVLVVSTFLGLAANFGGGWIAMRWPIQRLMGLGMAVLAVALIALPMVTTFTHVMLYGMAMGIAGGIVTVVFFSVWGQVFGRQHLGRIQGAAQMLTVVASAIGPLLLALTYERTGSYNLMFGALAAIVVALGFASWFVPLPRRDPITDYQSRLPIAGVP